MFSKRTRLCTRGVEDSRDRWYDFLNIFAEKFSEEIGVFDSKKLNYAKF
jgi:hypothetical protein